jgi:arylsulfatase A-like enzyme
MDRPNVLLLVIDALRADAVEAYGGPPGVSVTLGKLADRGAAIPDVRSTAPWTLPSHTALFSGQLARGVGLGQAPREKPPSAAPVVRAQQERLLATVLSRAGYATKGATTNMWAGGPSGFNTGFEEFADLNVSRQMVLGGGTRGRIRWDWECVRARADDGASATESILRRWAGQLDERPFFWFVNLLECHSPYLPPKPYCGISPLRRLRTGDEAFRYLTFESTLLACLGKLTVPEGAIKRMRRMYTASLRYVDDWLGRSLDALSSAGALDNTLVVVTADHGENFGVAGLMAHGMSLDDRLLRVPLIVAGPGWETLRGMRSLVELPTRIAGAAEIESHPFSPELETGLPVAQWDPFELSEDRLSDVAKQWDLGEAEVDRLTAPLTCAVSGRWKLVRGREEADESLYDLEADPLELNPLLGEDAISAAAGAELAALRAAVNHPAAQARAQRTGDDDPSPDPDPVPEDELAELERKMRLMGYM